MKITPAVFVLFLAPSASASLAAGLSPSSPASSDYPSATPSNSNEPVHSFSEAPYTAPLSEYPSATPSSSDEPVHSYSEAPYAPPTSPGSTSQCLGMFCICP
ncbi:hypothetical protein FisN_29Hu028 [Fistulifera solaris]|uniref:Uncharacterized protein n=1 Tax=Fistulifera solaris TaxID=1519565 RepID=A0A1Z5K5W4_FISSO|nr:hypothetical protein FisN_29Hu028 [Fistulifera solaris]|eukprot:GAX21595.1 hypothetical protein FisN_29Hu028 [Fistulifera solaris]